MLLGGITPWLKSRLNAFSLNSSSITFYNTNEAVTSDEFFIVNSFVNDLPILKYFI